MKNEPQLSAEMERKWENTFNTENDQYRVETWKAKHFLATALEEQRASMIAEIESWLVDEEVHELENASWDEMRQQASKIGRNELRAELRAKLVEMNSEPN